MHSVANLASLQTPLESFFFTKKSAQTLFSLQESAVQPHKVLHSHHALTPLSLSLSLSLSPSVCSVSVQRAAEKSRA